VSAHGSGEQIVELPAILTVTSNGMECASASAADSVAVTARDNETAGAKGRVLTIDRPREMHAAASRRALAGDNSMARLGERAGAPQANVRSCGTHIIDHLGDGASLTEKR
jgi:hypothetical protein